MNLLYPLLLVNYKTNKGCLLCLTLDDLSTILNYSQGGGGGGGWGWGVGGGEVINIY